VLSAFDDYPIHQTGDPIAHTASGDLNHYDRYFFNGYTTDGALYFGAAMGLYPNRRVIDAAFSVVKDGLQVSVHASALATADRGQTAVGPIAVDVREPLRTLNLKVDAPEHAVRADVTFHARTVAVEEPRFRNVAGTRVVMDYTRLAQWGTWDGWIEIDSERIDLHRSSTWGSRDRSWGIRGVGERAPGAPAQMAPQFYWLWAPVNFDDVCTHFDVNEHGDGQQWHRSGYVIPVLGDPATDAVLDPGGLPVSAEPMSTVECTIDWEPGTRRATHARIEMSPWNASPLTVDLEPIVTFQMMGIGYFHPDWSHGVFKGDLAVGGERWKTADLDPLAIQNVHIQALCRARLTGRGEERVGMGILEQLVLGVHEPSGFTGLLDGAPA
jgi:hypothetical protein